MSFQRAPARPLTDTDFSLLLKGVVKDEGREPYVGFKCGDKLPALHGTFLSKENGGFSQAFVGFPAFFKFLNEIDAVILYPNEEKVSKTISVSRKAAGGKLVPSGTVITVMRRADGAISMRVANRDARDAVFPIRLEDGIDVETRTESGTPQDMRHTYKLDALTYTDMIRQAAYFWKNELTVAGNAQTKEELREKFSGGANNFS